MNGEENGLVRYDNDTDLGSLVGRADDVSMPAGTDPTSTADSPLVDRVGVSTPA
jgi:hypothetical protein